MSRAYFPVPHPSGRNDNPADDPLRFAAEVAEGTAKGIVDGISGTVSDTLTGFVKIGRGDFKGAAAIVESRVVGMVKGAFGAVESGLTVGTAGYDAVVNDQPFMTETNKRHLIRLSQMGIYLAAGGTLFDEDQPPEGTRCNLSGDACNTLPGIENGVFVGDDSDLKTLIAAGEDPDAATLAPGEAARSAAVRSQFLEAHGIDDAGGWHVHHIKPVGVGGPDAVDNMVLIDPAKHAEITAAHADYYGWPKFNE